MWSRCFKQHHMSLWLSVPTPYTVVTSISVFRYYNISGGGAYNVWSASSEELLLLLIQVYDCTLCYLHFGCRISPLTGVVVTADRRRVFTAAGQHLEHRTVIRISIIRLCNEEDRLQHWKVIYWNLLKGRPGLITDGCLQQKLPGAEREVLHSVTLRERTLHITSGKNIAILYLLDMNFISVVFVQLSEPVRKNHLDSIQDRTHLSLPP